MTDPWPLRSSLELGALSTAASCACLHVKHVLRESTPSRERRAPRVRARHQRGQRQGQPGQTVSVNLAGTATRVLIEVWDADPQPPGPREPGGTRLKWYPTQDPPGKVVWCELATAPAAATADTADTAPPAQAALPAGYRAPGSSRRPRS